MVEFKDVPNRMGEKPELARLRMTSERPTRWERTAQPILGRARTSFGITVAAAVLILLALAAGFLVVL